MFRMTHDILIPLEQSLTTLKGWDNWLIGNSRFLFEGMVPDRSVTCKPAVVLRQSASLVILQSEASWKGGRASLRLLLIRPTGSAPKPDAQTADRHRRDSLPDAGATDSDRWRRASVSVSREELNAFLCAVPDTNSLHRSVDPILPGMLLMNRLLTWSLEERNDFPGLLQADTRFFVPLRCGQPLYLVTGQDRNHLLTRLDTVSGACAVRMQIPLHRQATESSTGSDSAAMADNYATLSLQKGGTQV